MKLYKLDAVVLHARDCGRADKLLTLFSIEQGKIKVIAHGAGKPTSRKRGGVQPFTRSRFLIRRGRELDSVSQCEGMEMFLHLRESFGKLTYASYLVEMVDAMAPAGEPSEPLFHLLLTTLQLMAGGDPEVLTLSFGLKAAGIFGYQPEFEVCAGCRSEIEGNIFFNPALGGIICARCREDAPGTTTACHRGMVETMKILSRWHPDKLHQLKIDARTRENLFRLLHGYLSHHLETELKSAAFLNRLGGSGPGHQ